MRHLLWYKVRDNNATFFMKKLITISTGLLFSIALVSCDWDDWDDHHHGHGGPPPPPAWGPSYGPDYRPHHPKPSGHKPPKPHKPSGHKPNKPHKPDSSHHGSKGPKTQKHFPGNTRKGPALRHR